jgi:CotS family spore coat protein
MSIEIFTEEDRQRERERLTTYDLDVKFFEDLGLKIKQLVPERNCFRLESDKGFYCLKKIYFPLEEIMLMKELAKHLEGNGFRNTFDIVVQEKGEIAIPYRGSQYYLTKWMDGRDSDYLNLPDIKGAVEALGRFHLAAEGFRSSHHIEHRRLYGKWKQGFARKLKEMREAGEQLAAMDHEHNSIQVLVDYVDKCKENAKNALRLLEEPFYECINARDAEGKGFIHHDFGLHNILHTFDGRTYIGGLESYAFDIRMHDLGHFMYRMMRRQGWDLEMALDIIGAYHEVYSLKKEDYQALCMYLTFPHDFKQLYRQRLAAGEEPEELEETDRVHIESEYNLGRQRFLLELMKYVALL